MNNPTQLPNIRLITISGRIASGSTTLAKGLADVLCWKHIEGGEVFWEEVRKKLNLNSKDTDKRPDQEDLDFDASLKKMIEEEKNLIIETKLAGFIADGIKGVFKILVICQNENGEDQTGIRMDRLINREGMSVEHAKEEVLAREQNDLEKWRKLYAKDDQSWVYWDPKYYDLIINTYSHNQEESLKIALKALGLQNKFLQKLK